FAKPGNRLPHSVSCRPIAVDLLASKHMWHPELTVSGAERELHVGWHDADHQVSLSIQLDAPPDQARIGPKVLSPESLADHNRRRCSVAAFSGEECSTCQGSQLEQVEEVGRHSCALEFDDLFTDRELSFR